MDSEYALLEYLSGGGNVSQRQVAKQTGLSLGMVNLILKRLARTGAIKVVALNGRSASYLLTPTGAAAKSRRAYEYLLRTIGIFRELRERTDGLIAELYRNGAREFIIHGEGEVADIAELCLSRARLPGLTFSRSQGALPAEVDPTRAVLECSFQPGGGYVGVSVLERLVRTNG